MADTPEDKEKCSHCGRGAGPPISLDLIRGERQVNPSNQPLEERTADPSYVQQLVSIDDATGKILLELGQIREQREVLNDRERDLVLLLKTHRSNTMTLLNQAAVRAGIDAFDQGQRWNLNMKTGVFTRLF